MCGWARRPAMADPSCCTTSNQKEPRPTFASRRRLFMAQRKALGRGLSALLGTPSVGTVVETPEDNLREIDIDRILPNAQQPRRNFDDDALNELAESIRIH